MPYHVEKFRETDCNVDPTCWARNDATNILDLDVTPPPGSRKRKRPSAEPHRQRDESQLSIYSFNCNGIDPFLQTPISSYFQPRERQQQASSPLRDMLRRYEWPTVFFLQEVKISSEDYATIRAVERSVKLGKSNADDAFDYEAHFCLPSDQYNARGFRGKIYGVCSIVRKDFANAIACIRPVSWDREGRLLIIETIPSQHLPKLALINIYAVNGTDNPYKDPETGQVIGTRHDRKLQFHQLLQQECRNMEARGFAVVLAGDSE